MNCILGFVVYLIMNTIKPNIRCYDNKDVLVEAAANLIAEHITQHIKERGKYRLALAGGNTPRPVYHRLAQPDLATTIDWPRVHVFWGDERCVPADNKASNYHIVYSALLSHVPISKSNVHRIEVEYGQTESARRYAEILGNEPLDIVLLGMGDDGHTASLFPDTPDLSTDERVIPTISPMAPVERVSISLMEINQAREVCLLVAGKNKAQCLAEVHQQIETGKQTLPTARVQPHSGLLFWLSDAAAAKLLTMANH